jgi:hypothetical protein
VGNNPETNSDPSGNFFVADPIIGRSVGSPTSSASGGFSYVPRPIIRPVATPVKLAPSDLPITDQRSLNQAFFLAQTVAWYRHFTNNYTRHDFAAAEWYLTDQQNNGNFVSGADSPLGGYHFISLQESNRPGGDPITHSGDAEQLVLSPWLNGAGATFALLASKIARLTGVHAVLHIVLFTELPPCSQCRGFFDNTFLPSMASIGTAIMNAPPWLIPWPTGETAISLDVYAKNPSITGGDWTIPITRPGDLVLSYHQSIPFVDQGSPPGTI